MAHRRSRVALDLCRVLGPVRITGRFPVSWPGFCGRMPPASYDKGRLRPLATGPVLNRAPDHSTGVLFSVFFCRIDSLQGFLCVCVWYWGLNSGSTP
jgi:hypothetical protein